MGEANPTGRGGAGCSSPNWCAWPRPSSLPAPSRSATGRSRRGCPKARRSPPSWRQLQRSYERRGVNLVRVGAAWAFRTAPDLAFMMSRDAVQQKKLSRAALEVLAIIAYHQPVTRAEIEEIRGVETSKGTLDTLLETEWVRMRGRRRTPGRPVTYGTTDRFLDHFSLEEIRDLPGIEELKGAGLLVGPHAVQLRRAAAACRSRPA